QRLRVVLVVGTASDERQSAGLIVPVEPLTVVARGQQIAATDSVIDLEEEQLFILRVLRLGAGLLRRGDYLFAANQVALVADEEVRAILDQRSAGRSAKSLRRKRWPSRRERRPVVQEPGLSEHEGRTAQSVRPRIGDGQRHGGERFAEFSRELAREHLHFTDAVEPVA